MFEGIDPKALKYWLILAALVYLLLPWDFLPDFLGLPGRVDDLLMMAWLAWIYRRHASSFVVQDPGREARGDSARADYGAGKSGGRGSGQESGHESAQGSAGAGGPGAGSSRGRAGAPDAYAVLGIPHTASNDAIRAAYRARMMEYHPDKVAHLGEDLQKLAHEKSQQIQQAYQQLRR